MKQSNNIEVEAIKEAINTYFEGIKALDYEQIYKVYHKDANFMSADSEGKFVKHESSVWKNICGNMKKNIPDLNDYKVTASIENIDLVKTAASIRAKVRIETPERISNFTDYYHMLKLEGKWMIVAKSFYGDHQIKQ